MRRSDKSDAAPFTTSLGSADSALGQRPWAFSSSSVHSLLHPCGLGMQTRVCTVCSLQAPLHKEEFPSLKDVGPSTASAARTASAETFSTAQSSSAAAPKPTPYRPSFLTDKGHAGWTSKLADAPAVPTPAPAQPAASPRADDAQPSAAAPAAAPQQQAPAPVATAPPLSGWGAAAGAHGGETVKSKLLETLPSSNGATSSITQDADAFRAQLAVRQSKQLIPVLARKGDAPAGHTAGGGAVHLNKQPSMTVLQSRSALVGGGTMLRQASTGAERLGPVVTAAVQGDVSADGKLHLRPLGRKTSQSALSSPGQPLAAESSDGGTKPQNGMVTLCRSPPPVARVHPVGTTTAPRPADATTAAGVAPALGSPTAHHPPATAAADITTLTTQPLKVATSVPHPPPAEQHQADEKPHPDQQARSGPAAAANQAASADHAALAGVNGGPAKAPAKVVGVAEELPPEELAFLVSLGWTCESDDDEGGEGLTEEEIAAFRAASAHHGAHSSRSSTPQLRVSAPASRTMSPAPFLATGATPPAPTLSPVSNGRSAGVFVPTSKGGVADMGCGMAPALVEVEPLFPGIAPGWFGGIIATASTGSPQSQSKASHGSQDGF